MPHPHGDGAAGADHQHPVAVGVLFLDVRHGAGHPVAEALPAFRQVAFQTAGLPALHGFLEHAVKGGHGGALRRRFLGVGAQEGVDDGVEVEFVEPGLQVGGQCAAEPFLDALAGLHVAHQVAGHQGVKGQAALTVILAKPARLLVSQLGELVVVGGAEGRLTVTDKVELGHGVACVSCNEDSLEQPA